MTDRLLAKEIELNRRHEIILRRREAILRGTETFYDAEEEQSSSFISDFAKSKERNKELLQNIRQCQRELAEDASDSETPKFQTIKNNYWVMVKNVFPVWQQEQNEYERSHR